MDVTRALGKLRMASGVSRGDGADVALRCCCPLPDGRVGSRNGVMAGFQFNLMMFNGEDTVTSCNFYKGSDDQQFAFPFW